MCTVFGVVVPSTLPGGLATACKVHYFFLLTFEAEEITTTVPQCGKGCVHYITNNTVCSHSLALVKMFHGNICH